MAWLVLGRRSPAGFGIHSKFSALVANTRLLTWKGVSEEESLQGTPRAVWNPVHRSLLSPVPSTQTPGPPVESPRDLAFCGAVTSVTPFLHTRQEPKPPMPTPAGPHAETRSNTEERRGGGVFSGWQKGGGQGGGVGHCTRRQ